jgi:radical SAM/Cys-rich protein
MHATLPLLSDSDFPRLRRAALQTLQINVGYRCNQACLHCHVNAGPTRKEEMSRATAEDVIAFLHRARVACLDITGGAPELNDNFRYLVESARELGIQVIDRCNLTVLNEAGMEDMARFLAAHEVEIIASLPCYLEENVAAQRGEGVYGASIAALRKLNALGYAKPGTGLRLNLMYNPIGPVLPPAQLQLEADYRRELADRAGVVFDRLLVLANMPIQRFGSTLISRGQFEDYLALLRSAHRDTNLATVMCRTLVSVDWQGFVYDCDFNQMLGITLGARRVPRTHLRDLEPTQLRGRDIAVAAHCYGCTAGQGSSCGGALE